MEEEEVRSRKCSPGPIAGCRTLGRSIEASVGVAQRRSKASLQPRLPHRRRPKRSPRDSLLHCSPPLLFQHRLHLHRRPRKKRPTTEAAWPLWACRR